MKKKGVAPHDLRRTCAKFAHKGGAAIYQIQISFGHESIQTTEEYLGVEQDLIDTPCDHLGLRLGELCALFEKTPQVVGEGRRSLTVPELLVRDAHVTGGGVRRPVITTAD